MSLKRASESSGTEPGAPLTQEEREAAVLTAYERLFMVLVHGAVRSIRNGGSSAGDAAAFLAMLTGEPESEITRRLGRKF